MFEIEVNFVFRFECYPLAILCKMSPTEKALGSEIRASGTHFGQELHPLYDRFHSLNSPVGFEPMQIMSAGVN